MDWNTLPLWVRFAICYLAGFPLLIFMFAIEWALEWLNENIAFHDNVDEHAERPNPL